ncbi:MAG: membrane protein insertase YidC [Syntrophales bacterium]
MEKRAILAIVLSFVVVMLYQYFFVKPQVPKQPPPVQTTGQAAVETTKEPVAPPAAAIEPSRQPISEQDVKVDTPLYTAVFTTRGGALKSFKLKKYRRSLDRNSPPVELVDAKEGINYPLSLTFPDSSINIPLDEVYRADVGSVELSGENTGRITFSASYPNKSRIEKVFTFYADRYNFDMEVRFFNSFGQNLSETALLTWNQYIDPKAEEAYGHLGPVYYMKNDIHFEDAKKMETKKLGPDVSWGGFESKYFIAAMIPKQPSLTSLVLVRNTGNAAVVGLEGPRNIIPSGQTGLFNYSIYMGPKEYNVLKAQKVGLEESIDFGWIKWLALPLLVVLKFLYQYVHNYGVAIIIITIIIKIIFWPLGNKSYKSMKEMQKLQPHINELREKFKNDKARLNQEVMQLYKRYKINPLGGCLPMIIQIPVFFGLYKTLLYSIELRHSPLAFWIQDLSAKDPYYITPIVMGATMFWQQKISPQVGDPTQAKLMLLMPVIFTFLFLNFPSGLVIYWLFNNILSIGQQYYINKRLS